MSTDISSSIPNVVDQAMKGGIDCATRAYCRPPEARRITTILEPGTQAKIIELGAAAERIGLPLKHHLSLRLVGLALCGSAGALSGLHPADATQHMLTLMRLWHANRRLRWAGVWVRENSSEAGEHVHLALHLNPDSENEFVDALVRWTGEEPDGRRRKPASKLVGRSEFKNWDLRRDVRRIFGNPDLMAYLGKAEPNRIHLWGRKRDNQHKADRNRNQLGGRIEGSPHQDYRWGFTRGTLGPRALARQTGQMQ